MQGGPGGRIMAESLADVSRCQRGRPISQQVVQHSLHASTKVTQGSRSNQAPFTLACLRPCVISLRVCPSYADTFIFLPTLILFIPLCKCRTYSVRLNTSNYRQRCKTCAMIGTGLLLDACMCRTRKLQVTLICLERGTVLLATLALTASFPVRVLSPPD